MKRLSIFEGFLIGIASFGIGGLAVLLLNHSSNNSIKPLRYNCNIQAILEPEKNDKKD